MREKGLAPSIIAADYGRFGEELDTVAPHAVRWHVDVMDGHYVPNLTIGPAHVEVIAKRSQLPRDVHLMITNPDETWQWYAEAGASRIAFHPDATPDAAALLKTIAAGGVGPGLAVNPGLPVEAVAELLPLVDHVIVMSVHPGFSGQKFIPEVLRKLGELRRLRSDVVLVIDGGVNPGNAERCVEAGADVLVSASAVFHAADPASVARELAAIAGARL